MLADPVAPAVLLRRIALETLARKDTATVTLPDLIPDVTESRRVCSIPCTPSTETEESDIQEDASHALTWSRVRAVWLLLVNPAPTMVTLKDPVDAMLLPEIALHPGPEIETAVLTLPC